jgi:hypothetical protein
MKWFVALALVVASASIVIPVVLFERQSHNDPLDQIHESASF